VEAIRKISNLYLEGLMSTDEYMHQLFRIMTRELDDVHRAAVCLYIAEAFSSQLTPNL
jgi:hypothetical protein